MKRILFTIGIYLCAAASVYASENDRHFEGNGTWTDTNGKTGTLTVSYRFVVVSEDLAIGTDEVVLSDGRRFGGTADFVYSNPYKYTVKYKGIPVGKGVCVGGQCQTHVKWSGGFDVDEIAIWGEDGSLERLGTLSKGRYFMTYRARLQSP